MTKKQNSYPPTNEEATILEYFRKSITQKSLYHSYLFVGADSRLLENLVQHISQSLLCLQGAGAPCQSCQACRKVKERIHPDVWISPSILENKPLNISEVRDVIGEASLKPWEGNYKVFFLPHAHRMANEASHALLKTLEEPPKHSIFLLTTETTNSILPTILSRCQVFQVGSLGNQETERILIEEDKLSPSEAAVISRLSEGNISLAREIHQELWEARPRLLEILCQEKDPLALGEALHQFCGNKKGRKSSKEKAKALLTHLSSLVRDILFIQSHVPAEKLINQDYLDSLQKVARLHSPKRIESFLDFLLEAQHMVDCNVTISLIWENVSMYLSSDTLR